MSLTPVSPGHNPEVTQADRRGELLFVNVDLCADVGTHSTLFRASALVDCGAKECAISTALALKYRLRVDKKGITTYRGFGGEITSIGSTKLDVALRHEPTGVTRVVSIHAAVVDTRDPELLLGVPWVGASGIDPDFSTPTPRWTFKPVERKLQFADGLGSARAMANAPNLFVVMPKDMMIDDDEDDGTSQSPGPTRLPAWVEDFADVADDDMAGRVPDGTQGEHAINLTEGKEPPWGPIYPLGEHELATLRQYLTEAQESGRVRRSKSSAGAPILFTPKTDGSLRLCVDYRGLNAVTEKDRTPLPLMSEMFDRLKGAKYFTKLDLKDAYHRIRIRRGDEWKTAFRTRYGHFEYVVMPFGLANAPATFQAYMERSMEGLVDWICIVYMDDILIYGGDTLEEHQECVRQVLQRLRENGLYIKATKCAWAASEVTFLGFVIGRGGIWMEPNRVEAISEWPVPRTLRELQVFLGFINFYRKFIEYFSKVAAPMTELLKRSAAAWEWTESANASFETMKQRFTTAPLLRYFDPELRTKVRTDASGFALGAILLQLHGDRWHPVAYWSRKMKGPEERYLVHDQELLAIVEAAKHWRHYLLSAKETVEMITDHNNLKYFLSTKKLNGRQARAAEYLSQFDIKIVFEPGKTNPADALSRRPDYGDAKSGTADAAMLPVLQDLIRTPRAGAAPGEFDEVDIASLEVVTSADTALRFAEGQGAAPHAGRGPPEITTLRSAGSLKGSHPAETTLGADPQSSREWASFTSPTTRKATAAQGVERETRARCPRRQYGRNDAVGAGQANVHEIMELELPDSAELTDVLLDAQRGDAFAKTQVQLVQSEDVKDSAWSVDASGLLRQAGKVYVPQTEKTVDMVVRQCHDDPSAGHYGGSKTLRRVCDQFYWPRRRRDVLEYVRRCDICQRMKSRRHRPYGELQSLQIPGAKDVLKHWSMDFVVGLPMAQTRHGDVVDAILVIVDRLSKLAIYEPVPGNIDAPMLADVVEDVILTKYGLPLSIVSDRGSLFTSRYWGALTRRWAVKRRLSTAFHPQTDGQTERQNQVMETFLRCFINFEQNDWPYWLQWAAFAHNSTHQDSLGCTPHRFVFGTDPRRPGDVGNDATEKGTIPEVPAAEERFRRMGEMRATLAQNLEEATKAQAKYYNAKHLPMTFAPGTEIMLNARNLRTVRPSKKFASKFVGPFTIRDRIGKMAYRLDLPDRMKGIHDVFHVSMLEPYARSANAEPPAEEIQGEMEFEVETIVKKGKRRDGSTEYLVKWTGYPHEENTWEPAQHLDHAAEAIADFEKTLQDATPLPLPKGPRRRKGKGRA